MPFRQDGWSRSGRAVVADPGAPPVGRSVPRSTSEVAGGGSTRHHSGTGRAHGHAHPTASSPARASHAPSYSGCPASSAARGTASRRGMRAVSRTASRPTSLARASHAPRHTRRPALWLRQRPRRHGSASTVHRHSSATTDDAAPSRRGQSCPPPAGQSQEERSTEALKTIRSSASRWAACGAWGRVSDHGKACRDYP